MTAFSAGPSDVLVHNAWSGASRVYRQDAVRNLFQCIEFRALEEHALRLCRGQLRRQLDLCFRRADKSRFRRTGARLVVWAISRGAELPIPPAHLQAAQRELEKFIGDGFLVSDLELANEAVLAATSAQASAEEEGDDAAALSVIGIPTCDRSAGLIRGAESYIEHAARHGRAVELLIVDDSEAQQARCVTAQGAKMLRGRHAVNVQCLDRQQRWVLARNLAGEAGVDSAIAEFGLLGNKTYGPTIGAARNTLLLACAGTRLLQVDDDSICRPARIPDAASSGLSLSSAFDSGTYWFFSDYESIYQTLEPGNVDLIEEHDRLLGRSVAALIRSTVLNGGDLVVDDLEPSFLHHVRSSAARVRVTLGGIAGDIGRHNRAARLSYRGTNWTRLCSNYRRNASARLVVRSGRGLVLGDRQMCAGANIGLDNRMLLPPFLPVMRSEDLLFGTVLRVCCPAAFRGYLPYVTEHRPVALRKEDMPLLARFNTGEILSSLVGAFGAWYPASSETAAMTALGTYLRDIVGQPGDDFKETVQTECRQNWVSRMACLQQLVEQRSDAPRAWKKDVKTHLCDLERTILDEERSCVPWDLEERCERPWHAFQEITRMYGELLVHWPGLVEAAKALRAEDGSSIRWRPVVRQRKKIRFTHEHEDG